MTKQNQTCDELSQVDLIDQLMTYYRNKVEPPDQLQLKAYKAGIAVDELKRYVQEFEQDV